MSENQQNLSSKLEKARQQLQKAQARVAQLEAQLSAKSPNTAPVLKSDDDLQAMRHFLQTTLDAFPAHTVVLDPDGTIISANLSWKQFAQENSAASTNLDLGGNYLASCDHVIGLLSEDASAAVAGIRAVIAGKKADFNLEYAFNTSTEERWFALRVIPFAEPSPRRVIVAHINITEHKQAEKALQHYTQRMEILHEIDLGIINAHSIQDVVNAALQHIRRLFACQQVIAVVFDFETNEALIFASDVNTPSVIVQGNRYPIQPDMLTDYGPNGISVMGDFQSLPESDPGYRNIRNEGMRSGLRALLTFQRNPVGLLVLNADTPNYFTVEHQAVAAEIANQLAIAIHQMQLSQALERHMTLIEQRVADRTAELQASKERGEAILNNSTDGIVLLHRDLSIQQTNSAFNRLFECDPDDYFGQSLVSLVQAEEADRVTRSIQAVIDEQKEAHIETHARRKSGTFFDVEFSIAQIKGNGLVCSIHDISKRKAQEHQLRFDASIQKNLSDSVISTDLEFVIQSWNHAAEVIYGWSADEAIGKTIDGLLHADLGSPEGRQRLRQHFLEIGYWTGDVEEIRKDGSKVLVRGSVTRLDDENNIPYGFTSVFRDVTEIRAQERQLRHQASLQENVSDAVIVTDMQFRVQSWNKAAERIYGWRADEVINRTTAEILHTEIASGSDIEISKQDLFKQGWWQGEVIHYHKDGTPRYILGSVTLVKDEKGLPFSVISVNHDITERKQVEVELQKSAAAIHDLYNNAPCGYHSVDQDGVIVQINDTELHWLGYQRDEVLGKLKMRDIFTPESVATFEKSFPLFKERGWISDLEFEVVRKDGSLLQILLNATAIYDEQGQYIQSRSILFDITKLRQTEQEVIESEARYRLLAENIADIIMTFSMDRLITYMSPSCGKLLGYSSEEVEGHSHSEFIHPDDYPQVIDKTLQAVTSKEAFYTNQFRLRHKAGHYIWFEVRTRIVFDPNTSKVVQFISVMRDITERRRADDALRESEERFRHAIIDAPFPIMIHANDGEVLHISNVWSEISGYTHAEIPTMGDWTKKAYGENHLLVGAVIEKVYTLTKPQRGGEFRIRTKSGEERIWDFSSAPLALLPDGRQVFSSMAMDITERKRAEAALDASLAEEREFQGYLKALHEITIELTQIDDLATFYRRVVELGIGQLGIERLALFLYDPKDGTALGTFGTDEHGNITDERQIHFTPSPEGMMHRAFQRKERFYFDENVTLFKNMEPVGIGWNAATILWNGTQSVGWLVADNLLTQAAATKPLMDIFGLYALTVGTLLAQKQIQIALQESETRYRMLAENISDVVTRSNAETEFLYVSRSIYGVLGYEPEELLGRPAFDLIHPEDVAKVKNDLVSTLKSRFTSISLIFRCRHKQGHYVWLETSGRAIRSEDTGKVEGFVASSRDVSDRKRAEEALRESQQMLHNVIENIPIRLFWKDRNSVYRGCNTLHAQSIGLSSPADFVGKTEFDFFPERASQWLAEDHQVMQTGQSMLNFEEFFTDADGSSHWVRSSKVPLLDPNGAVNGVLVTIEDITERKQIATELERQRLFLRKVIDVSPSMIFVKDYDGRFVLANEFVAQMANSTVDDLIGKKDSDFSPSSQEVESFLEADRHVITSGEPLYIEEQVTDSFGETRWFQTTKVPITAADNVSRNVLGVATDITERIYVESALRESEEKYRSLIETMRGGLAIFDANYAISYVNDRFCELTGYSREEALGKNPTYFVDDANLPELHLQLARRQQLESTTYEMPVRRKDGSTIYLLMSGSPMFNKDGKGSGSFVVATDITLQKQAEETLRQNLAKEKELGELKSRFVSMASHEFRTPLATILATTETLSAYRDKLSAAQIDQRFDKIKEQVGHLKDIMEDVLLLARMQSRRVEYTPGAMDLDDLCRSVLDEFQSRNDVKQPITFDGGSIPRQIILDKKLMRQMISNLVSNAIKYSSDDKPIAVKLEYTPALAVLSVRDEGIGIPAADLPHLFEPFHRATNVGTVSGTGLGLVITKESIELHGGTITVDSQVGVGTTFTVRLPIGDTERTNDEKPTD